MGLIFRTRWSHTIYYLYSEKKRRKLNKDKNDQIVNEESLNKQTTRHDTIHKSRKVHNIEKFARRDLRSLRIWMLLVLFLSFCKWIGFAFLVWWFFSFHFIYLNIFLFFMFCYFCEEIFFSFCFAFFSMKCVIHTQAQTLGVKR